MSYSGSPQQYGLSDLQILQQRVMLAQLQELQNQQQLGDGKSQSSLNYPFLFGKQPLGGQIANNGSGTLLNSSQMFAASNMNWMYHNVSSPMQGVPRGSAYSHDQGIMLNQAFQQPSVSLYGTPVANASSLGQYSPSPLGSHVSANIFSLNSEQKTMTQVSPFSNSFLDAKRPDSPDASFMQKQGMQVKGPGRQTSVQMLNNGLPPRSPLQLNSQQKNEVMQEFDRGPEHPGFPAYLQGQTKTANESRGTTALDPLEEKILFDTEDSGWGTSFSKLASMATEECMSSPGGPEFENDFPSVQSGSWSALMQSAVAEASSSDTGVQEELSGLSFQNIELSTDNQTSKFCTGDEQFFSKLHIPGYNLRPPTSSSDSIKSSASALLQQTGSLLSYEQDMNKSSFNTSAEQQPSLPTQWAEMLLNQRQSASVQHLRNDSTGASSGAQLSNYENVQREVAGHQRKRIDEMQANLSSHLGENSNDSYNSKMSQAYSGQSDNACQNAEDSESTAKTNIKSSNQVLFMSSPGSINQYEGFSSLKPPKAFATSIHSMTKGNPNLPANTFSKGSPVSDMSASMDSQYASEVNSSKINPQNSYDSMQFNPAVCPTKSRESEMPKVTVQPGMPSFSFQKPGQVNPRHAVLGNGERTQTWWTPSSFEISASTPPVQASPLSGKLGALGKTGIETANLNSDGYSLAAVFSGLQNAKQKAKGIHITNVSTTGGYHQSVSPSGHFHDNYPVKNISLFGGQLDGSGALPLTQPPFISGMQHQGMKHLNEWINKSSQMGGSHYSGRVSPDVHSSVNQSFNSHVTPSRVAQEMEHSSRGGSPRSPVLSDKNENFGKDCSEELKSPVMYSGGKPQQLHNNLVNFKRQSDPSLLGNNSVRINKVDIGSSTASSDLNRQQNGVVGGQQLLHEAHTIANNPFASQFTASLKFSSFPSSIHAISSGASSRLIGNAPLQSSIQSVSSDKVPACVQNDNHVRAQTTPAWYPQHEYTQNGQRLSSCDSKSLSSLTSLENLQLHRASIHTSVDGSGNYVIMPSSTSRVVTVEQRPSSMFLPDVSNANLALSKTRKRKTAMFDCEPWHKLVMCVFQDVPDVSRSEQEWAEVSHRMVEKSVEDGNLFGQLQPAARAKKRLVVTTQLMQQVFRPSPGIVLSVDSTKGYEFVAYSVAKLAIADACSMTNKMDFDCGKPRRIGNMLQNGRRDGNLSLCEVVGELFQRGRKLESDLERLDNSMSVVDIRMDCQELEKIIIINHLARYHSRILQSAAADSAPASLVTTSVRPPLQKYVTPAPLPPKLPSGVLCLAL